MKVSILDPTDSQETFVIDGKKDEVVGVITTYISREIRFHSSRIDYPYEIWKKLKSLFDKVNESQVIQIEKKLISLDLHSFVRIENHLACVKEIQLKLGDCRKNF